MKRWLWGLPLLLLVMPAWASPSLFDIPLGDQSRVYLQQLFGQVGDFLAGANLGHNPLKDSLALFNNCALVLGGIVILYSLVVSTLNTAHEGEALGKRWNSVWIPIRSAMGFGLLLPTTSGYSVIQVFVMWVVVQGIGAADYVWVKYGTNIAQGTYNTTVNTTYSGAEDTGGVLDDPANEIFNNLVCANSAQKIMGTTGPIVVDNGTQYVFTVDGSKQATCGALQKSGDSQVDAYLMNFVNQINTNSALPFSLSEYNIQFLPPEQQGNPPSSTSILNGIQTAMQQYSANINQLAQNAANTTDSNTGGGFTPYGYYTQTVQNVIDKGWLYAGSLYMTVLRLQSTAPQTTKSGQSASKDTITTAYPQVTVYQASNLHLGQNAAQFNSIMTQAQQLTANAQYTSLAPSTGQATIACSKMTTSTRAQNALDEMTKLCNRVTSRWGVLINEQQSMTGSNVTSSFSPIINLAQWGQAAVNAVAWTWIAMFAAITAGAIGGIVLSVFFPGVAEVAAMVTTALFAYVAPIFMMIMSFYFVNGAIAGYYIPILPFLIYTLTAIGWFFLVIESMVAAPLMALGILHPEGQHDVFGHASAGLMILAGVFLRPVLMVIGFIASTLVVTVVIQMVNTGFYEAVFNVFSANAYMSGGKVNGLGNVKSKFVTVWGSLILTMMYVTILFTTINRAFTLIYLIPDKVMRWIGAPGEQSGVEGDMQAMKGGFDQTSKQFENTAEGTGKSIGAGLKQLRGDAGGGGGGGGSSGSGEGGGGGGAAAG